MDTQTSNSFNRTKRSIKYNWKTKQKNAFLGQSASDVRKNENKTYFRSKNI